MRYMRPHLYQHRRRQALAAAPCQDEHFIFYVNAANAIE